MDNETLILKGVDHPFEYSAHFERTIDATYEDADEDDNIILLHEDYIEHFDYFNNAEMQQAILVCQPRLQSEIDERLEARDNPFRDPFDTVNWITPNRFEALVHALTKTNMPVTVIVSQALDAATDYAVVFDYYSNNIDDCIQLWDKLPSGNMKCEFFFYQILSCATLQCNAM